MGINCLSGEPVSCTIDDEDIILQPEPNLNKDTHPYIGPGLIDLQVNGINGIDFNSASLTVERIIDATKAMLRQGVTTYFPTIVTNKNEAVIKILDTIRRACDADILVRNCIGGIHLEGPFISSQEGARGAHDRRYIQDPDIRLIKKFQDVSVGMIKIITLAPELNGAIELIHYCREAHIKCAIGHSLASAAQIDEAIRAGAVLSTHLGNAVPDMLPRHPNILWDLLARDELYASIITDGYHLPDSFIRVVIKTKRDKAVLVSDVTAFAGLPAGRYQTHIGADVTLTQDGKIFLSNNPNYLAGSAKTLLENVQHLTERGIVSICTAWCMASINPATIITGRKFNQNVWPDNDLVEFKIVGKKIKITDVLKGGIAVI